jgi:uncharacterized protein YndB with AHSA1/START domain
MTAGLHIRRTEDAMKWIMYLAVALVATVGLAVVALLIIGGGRGEGRFDTTIEIDRPAPVVFAWVTEAPRLKRWVGWLVDILELTPSIAGVGARNVWVMEDRNNNNQRMDIENAVVAHEPNRLLAARLDVPDGFTGDVRYELEALGPTRTRLTYRATFQYQHWLAKLLEPIISRSARQKLTEDLARLKQLAEAE